MGHGLIREQRDPAFWRRIADHPEVEHIKYGTDFDLGALALDERTLPLASENGGLLFCRLDTLGRIWEVHIAYTPEGRGREAALASEQAVARIFQTADVIVGLETSHARLPKSFGFRAANEAQESPVGPARTWILTKDAWLISPAGRRAQCLQF